MIKKLQNLTIKDDFMFGAVMSEEKNCRGLLELLLGFPIGKIEISKEKSLIFNPEYKGVRLDIYAKDEANTHYNVEMQTVKKADLQKRSRYYHSEIDMEVLLKGADYTELPETYVIFVCDFDPFGEKKYRYTIGSYCVETGKEITDGSHTIFLNTNGRNEEEVSKELVKFLNYVKADLSASLQDFDDEYVKGLQKSVREVKESRGMEARYMKLELLLREKHEEGFQEGVEEGIAKGIVQGIAQGIAQGVAEGKAESILELLEELGDVPDALRETILSESNLEVLRMWNKTAAKAESVEEFQSKMQ